MNEKLILETLANHTKRLAGLQLAIAGLTALVISRLPNLSPEQIEILKNDIETQKKDSEALQSAGEQLLLTVQKL
jgi:flagellar biosynthesis/type III secretory pathway M-ring protein FliF/YscJ